MNITIETSWLTSILLIATRIGAILLFTPILSIAYIPARIRVLFIIAISILLTGIVDISHINNVNIGVNIYLYLLNELTVGIVMAFGILTAFAAFLFGGRILDFQMGFGVANLIDPATNNQSAMMGVILNMIAIMVFFSVDGHHMILRGISYSFDLVPVGMPLSELNMEVIVKQFGLMFVIGLMVVAPALFGILLLDLGLAVVARTMPQVNVFFISIPLKIFIGLSMTALSMQYILPTFKKAFESIFLYWQEVLV